MTPRRVLLVIHLILVLAGLGYLALSLAAGSTADANIGAGLAALWLIALGSPWGWLALAPGVIAEDWLFPLAAGSALLNLGLHATLTLRRAHPRQHP